LNVSKKAGFTVTSDAKVPPRSKPYKYPWDTMKVNDSFEFPVDQRSTVSTAASWYSKRHGGKVKFTVRKVSDKMCRCWRTV
jgi:hypothetical protein